MSNLKFKKAIVLIVNLLAIPLFLLSIPNRTQFPSLEKWCLTTSGFLLIQVTFQMVSLFLIMPKKRFLVPITIVIFYLFMFSHVFLRGINYPVDESVGSYLYAFTRNTEETVIEVVCLCIKAIISLYCGMLLFFVLKKEKNTNSIKLQHNVVFSKYTKILLLCIGLTFDVIYNLILLRTSLISYGATASVKMPYIIRLLSFFLLAGVSVCLSDKDIQKKKKDCIFIAFVIYRFITMFTGVRALSLISILLVGYIYFINVRKTKIRLRYIILVVILLQVLGGILLSIREIRSTGNFQFAVFARYIFSLKSNIILELMAENGITLNTVCEVYLQNNMVGTGGSQMLASILSVIPGISYISHLNFDEMILDSALGFRSIGGSYMADILFDFGGAYLIWCFFLGVIFAYVYEYCEVVIRGNNLFSIALMTPIILELSFCVRSSLEKMPRMIVWYFVILFIVYFIVNGFRRRQVIIDHEFC